MTNELRRQLANLLILIAFGMAVGRILSAELVLEPSQHRGPGETNPTRRAWPPTRPTPMPTFSSNDRSRWAAVRALVDEGTSVIGRRDPQVVLAGAVGPLAATTPLEAVASLEAGYRLRISPESNTGITFEDGWGTVDKVMNPATMEFYSTKPPLLTVLVAGEYWLIKQATGWTLKNQPQEVVRLILLTINALPLVLYLVLLAWLLEQHAASDWGRFYILGCAAFGTLVTPFLITFNNHTVGTFSALVAVYCVCKIWEGKGHAWLSLLAGLAAGFTATCDLPALALAACLGLVLLYQGWRRSPVPRSWILLYAGGALVPLIAQAALNFSLLGTSVEEVGGPWYRKALVLAKRGLGGPYGEFGGPWYKYEGSHWAREPAPGQKRRGIDFAREHESRTTYALHLLVGHHGVFSLTPFTLLTLAGVVMGLARAHRLRAEIPNEPPGLSRREDFKDRRDKPGGSSEEPLPAFLYPLTAVLSLVVVGFYLFQSDNYGGWTAGPRWLMWLTPLWLLTMLPAIDWLARRRWGRALAGLLLMLSVLSVSFPAWNPWRHPWIYRWLDAQGLIPY